MSASRGVNVGKKHEARGLTSLTARAVVIDRLKTRTGAVVTITGGLGVGTSSVLEQVVRCAPDELPGVNVLYFDCARRDEASLLESLVAQLGLRRRRLASELSIYAIHRAIGGRGRCVDVHV